MAKLELRPSKISKRMKTVHDFKVKNIDGEEVSLDQYKDKVLLIVNTASKCGFTPQLEDMSELYREFREEGLEILAFPSNDFAGQEPLEGEEIKQFCVTRYEAEYPIFEKVHVKGEEAHELFQYLSDKKENGTVGTRPRWNFTKYLVDKNGKVVESFLPLTKPTAGRIKRKIQKLLGE